MKRSYILLSVIIFAVSSAVCNFSFAQTPYIQWQTTFGGSNNELSYCIQQTLDSGFLVTGITYSTDGEVTGNHGNGDMWVVKISKTGSLSWEKCFGGSNTEQGFTIQQTTDSGYIVAGTTNSIDGDITYSHGDDDIWVIKLNDTGGIVWQKTYGGSGKDIGFYIQQTVEGGYIVAGATNSTDGEVTGYRGGTGFDYWVIKINDTGAITWQKTYGGTNDEKAWSIQQTSDSGYLVAGIAASADGDITYNHGGIYDYWVLRLNDTGTIVWQHTYGGSGDDEATSISQIKDGGSIMTGFSNSNDGDVTGLFGMYDIWSVKLNDTGGIVWAKCYGSTTPDEGYSIKQTTDNGYIMAGYVTSATGEVPDCYGHAEDMWVVKTDSSGNILWQKNLGGDSVDVARSIIQIYDGTYVITGWTASEDSDVTFNFGGMSGTEDIWVVKLGVNTISTTFIPAIKMADNIQLYPNPATASLTITSTNKITSIATTNIVGQTIYTSDYNTNNVQLNVAGYPAGVYFIKINGTEVRRFVKE